MNGKYKNWLISLDSDNFSMYIKTWFAFLASVHELVLLKATPGKQAELKSKRGDKVFLDLYRPELPPISIQDITKQNILAAFRESKIIIRSDYSEYYFKTYFKKIVEFNAIRQESVSMGPDEYAFDVNVKKDSLHIGIRVKNESLHKRLRTNFIQTNIKFFEHDNSLDMIDSADIFYPLVKFATRDLLYSNINHAKETKAYSEVTAKFDVLLQLIDSRLRGVPLHQAIFKLWCDENHIVDNDLKEWFFDFCYSLRNVMFHRIIDPFDERWSSIMKSSYQGLRELLLENIKVLELSAAAGHESPRRRRSSERPESVPETPE